jgi:chitin deacetylase
MRHMFALTFDDGPGPITPDLLDVLQKAGVRATFFLLGRNIEEAPWCGDPAKARALAVRAGREGHVIGNHTWSHFRPDRWRELAADLKRGEVVVRSVRAEAGVVEGTVPFRLPYGVRLIEQTMPSPSGNINAVSLDPRLPVLASLGRAHLHWTSDFEDWVLKPSEGGALAKKMIAHVEQSIALGMDAVLDLHDSGTGSASGYERRATLEGVRLLLEEAKRRKWRTFTFPQP